MTDETVAAVARALRAHADKYPASWDWPDLATAVLAAMPSRDAVLEEAAKVAEAEYAVCLTHFQGHGINTAMKIAAAIRAMKEK
jgi:tRNA G26 N,N-dimethylase Trm1